MRILPADKIWSEVSSDRGKILSLERKSGSLRAQSEFTELQGPSHLKEECC